MYGSQLEWLAYQEATRNDLETAINLLSQVAGMIDVGGDEVYQKHIDKLHNELKRGLNRAIREIKRKKAA